jgi:hypothetical protein
MGYIWVHTDHRGLDPISGKLNMQLIKLAVLKLISGNRDWVLGPSGEH